MTCQRGIPAFSLHCQRSAAPFVPVEAVHACVQLSLRYTLDVLLAGEGAPFSRTRHTVLTVGVVASSLAVALAVPDLAEKIFAVTGATGGAAHMLSFTGMRDIRAQARMSIDISRAIFSAQPLLPLD